MKFICLVFLCVVFFSGIVFAKVADGSGEFHLSRRKGIDLTVSIEVKNGKVEKVSYSEWTPVNRSAHECGFDAARGDAESKWTDNGSTTTVIYENDDDTAITISSRADGLLVQSRCDAMKILFVWREGKYVGRLLP